jgi:hypothetical protein
MASLFLTLYNTYPIKTICPKRLIVLNGHLFLVPRVTAYDRFYFECLEFLVLFCCCFVQSHTMYQVGLMETDTHIEYFWAALEALSQEELSRFIKFACNQERIPQTCPCREGGHELTHAPPYPMKIAPPDGPGVLRLFCLVWKEISGGLLAILP